MRPPIVIILIIAGILATGCGQKSDSDRADRPELLIYCGITMIKPMSEIAAIIEAQENCKITITKGGSGNLLQSIKVNRVGDLYLPGSETYIRTCLDEGLVTDTVFVGHNVAAIMVQKGNPRHIPADLTQLSSKTLYVVVGNPQSGSIGRETAKILSKRGILSEVMVNARRLTTDSKDLITVLKDQQADVVINWYATATWPENAPYVDILPIDREFAEPKRLVIGLLKTARYPQIAKQVMAYAATDAGRAIFRKYGLYHDQYEK